MGYLFLSIALLMSKVKGYCGKKISVKTTDFSQVLLISFMRMLICVPLGALFILFLAGGTSGIRVDGQTLIIAFISGVATAGFVVCWLLCIRTGAYVMIDLFLMLGIVVPLILSSVFFNEKIGAIKWFGVALLVVATVIMCWYSKGVKKVFTVKGLILLVTCGLFNGITQFAQKWFALSSVKNGVDASVFNFYSYLFASLTLFVVVLINVLKNKGKRRFIEHFLVLKKSFLLVFIMAISLFMHSYFSTRSASYLSTIELYPLQQGAGLILSVIMSALFFSERINLKCVVGIIVTITALFVINVLPSMV